MKNFKTYIAILVTVMKVFFMNKKQLEESTITNSTTSVLTFTYDDETIEYIQNILHHILDKYGKNYLYDSVYQVIHESVINCLKANAKRIFFKENCMDIHNQDDYERGIKLFKKEITTGKLRSYCAKGERDGLYVKIIFSYKVNGLKIEIINNLEILKIEEERIRNKFAQGMKSLDLPTFFSSHSDNTEGEGLGIVLSLFVLKENGIDPADFRIGSKNGVTKTRVEIPFNDTYISERKKFSKFDHPLTKHLPDTTDSDNQDG